MNKLNHENECQSTNEENKFKTKKKNLTNAQRQRIYELLLEGSADGKLPHGLLSTVAKRFDVTALTVSRIWRQGRQSLVDGAGCANVSSKIAARSGRKKIPIDLSVIERVPREHRTSFKALSLHTNIPKSTLFDALKGNLVKKGNFYHLKTSKSQKSN